jgi:hypothetical protein
MEWCGRLCYLPKLNPLHPLNDTNFILVELAICVSRNECICGMFDSRRLFEPTQNVCSPSSYNCCLSSSHNLSNHLTLEQCLMLCRPYWKSWEHLFYIKAKVHVQKRIPSWVTGDIPSLFHEMPRPIQVFQPALHDLEYAVLVEVCFSTLQPCTHCLLYCLVIFVVLASHVIF